MLNRTAEEWQRLCHLAALLDELPALTNELGFHYYHFNFAYRKHEISAGNLLPGGDVIVQAALDFRPLHLSRSDIPLIWEPKAFAMAPVFWTEAQALNLRHGWVQPVHQGTAHSSLALLRSHVSVSINELYQKAAMVMWLAERLYLAALCEAGVTDAHAPWGPSCAR
ncbi:autoinducer binding domain-containing protein [Pseudomonas putida]|uniref:autoinducer binding domain-containing protein n=1 Tax=Pseudomonas putida TaxID=303 RepID=UPI00300EFFCF